MQTAENKDHWGGPFLKSRYRYWFFLISICTACPASRFSQNKQKTADAITMRESDISFLLIIITAPIIRKTMNPDGIIIRDKISRSGERLLKQRLASSILPTLSESIPL